VTHLKPLFDAYTGPFNANAWFWTGLLLIFRFIILIASTTNSGGDPSKTADLTLLLILLLLAISLVLPGGLYRKHYLNILETWFLINLAFLSASVKPHFIGDFPKVASHLLVGLAFITAMAIVIYHISKVKAIKKILLLAVKYLCRKRNSQNDHMQSTLDLNDNEGQDQENCPRSVAVAEDREPLLAIAS
jgi:hypothetical protein